MAAKTLDQRFASIAQRDTPVSRGRGRGAATGTQERRVALRGSSIAARTNLQQHKRAQQAKAQGIAAPPVQGRGGAIRGRGSSSGISARGRGRGGAVRGGRANTVTRGVTGAVALRTTTPRARSRGRVAGGRVGGAVGRGRGRGAIAKQVPKQQQTAPNTGNKQQFGRGGRGKGRGEKAGRGTGSAGRGAGQARSKEDLDKELAMMMGDTSALDADMEEYLKQKEEEAEI